MRGYWQNQGGGGGAAPSNYTMPVKAYSFVKIDAIPSLLFIEKFFPIDWQFRHRNTDIIGPCGIRFYYASLLVDGVKYTSFSPIAFITKKDGTRDWISTYTACFVIGKTGAQMNEEKKKMIEEIIASMSGKPATNKQSSKYVGLSGGGSFSMPDPWVGSSPIRTNWQPTIDIRFNNEAVTTAEWTIWASESDIGKYTFPNNAIYFPATSSNGIYPARTDTRSETYPMTYMNFMHVE